MSIQNISLEQLNLSNPRPELNGAMLHGQLTIAGGSFHVTAVQVKVDDQGGLTAVCSEYDEDIEALYALSGDSLTTVTIDGKDYVLAIVPHAA